MARKRITIHDCPAPIKRRVLSAARQQRTSVNNVVNRILASRYGVEYEPTKRKRHQAFDEDGPIILKTPEDIHAAIRQHAERTGSTFRGLVVMALGQHYNIDVASPKSRHGDARKARKKGVMRDAKHDVPDPA